MNWNMFVPLLRALNHTMKIQSLLPHSPWWLVSVKPLPLAAPRQSPPAPPWQKCGGGCSHWLWQHQDGPCAATAAAQSQFSPGGMQCEGASAPPKQDTQQKKSSVTIRMKTSKILYHVCKCDCSSLTRARASTIAPFLRRHLTTSTWPARAAMCKAVSPRCANDNIWLRRVSAHSENLNLCSFQLTNGCSLCHFCCPVSHHSQYCWRQPRLRSAAGAGRCSGDPWRLLRGWASDPTEHGRKHNRDDRTEGNAHQMNQWII